ncbi:MAG: hypothetical protein AB7L66_05905 [Gemmatimonadales bacterium]
MRLRFLPLAIHLLWSCQQDRVVGVGDLPVPTGLSYQVEPSGTPGQPSGIVLRWDDTSDPLVDAWNVYGRDAGTGPWLLRGTTSSNSFHDRGAPQLEYRVSAVGGGVEGPASEAVTVDERLALDRPATLSSISLDGGVALVWSDDSYNSDPDGFWHYRVYGASYDLDRDLCGTDWSLEGTTVAPEFRVGALANGVPRCFAVSGIVIEGFESLWSPIRADTPRPEARNVALTARQVTDATAGFRFWRDQNANGQVERSELGKIGGGSLTDIDFAIERAPSGGLLLVPVRSGVTVVRYADQPIGDLTDIDLAPLGGYGRTPLELEPGFGYVVRIDPGDGFYRFGAIRVSHEGPNLVIFDWSYQTDPGNPELVIVR